MKGNRSHTARSGGGAVGLAALLLAACASAPAATSPTATDTTTPAATAATEPTTSTAAARPFEPADIFPSTYRPLPSQPTLVTGATILTATGERIEGGSILLRGGTVAAVGRDLVAPPDAVVVDGRGKWVTPGIIDVHSHLGVYASPGVDAHADGNEATEPVTAEVWAEHSLWPQDPQFPLALAGGVTSMQILPGSANLIGGRSVTVKNVPGRAAADMKFPGAPYGLKMACGENPKRVYREKGGPSTRMGNIADTRAAWAKAVDYRRGQAEYQRKLDAGEKATPPTRDLEAETLLGVLDGRILVHNHCYRADEMREMIDVAKEFGYRISAFHHATEAYKIADVLAANGICAALWADWWGFKMEALDGIRENLALIDAAKGGCAIVHSDSADGIQRLNQEAAKAMAAGRRMGLPLREEDAIRWLTINPAKAIGVDGMTGSLAPGKMADVVLWSGNPFSVYSHADVVWIDGALVYDRNDPAHQPRTDFSLGHDGRLPAAPGAGGVR